MERVRGDGLPNPDDCPTTSPNPMVVANARALVSVLLREHQHVVQAQYAKYGGDTTLFLTPAADTPAPYDIVNFPGRVAVTGVSW